MGGKSPLRTVVLAATAVAVGSLVLALAFGSVLHWNVPGFDRERSRGDGTPFEESRSVPGPGIGSVRLEAVSERLEVSYGTGDSFTVRLYGNMRPASAEEAPRLSVKNEGGILSVKVERKPIGGFWYDMVLALELPAGYSGSLAASSVSGAVEVSDGTFRDLALSSTSGAVRAGTMKAQSIEMSSTSGSLHLASADAEKTRLSSGSGSIEAGGLGGAVRADSTSGRILLDFRASPSEVDVQSTSGSVRVGFPEDARFVLDAGSTSGSVACAFPITISGKKAGDHSLAGTVNGGTQRVKIRTVSGSIRVRR